MPEQAEHDTGGRVTATRAAHKATAALCAARGGPVMPAGARGPGTGCTS